MPGEGADDVAGEPANSQRDAATLRHRDPGRRRRQEHRGDLSQAEERQGNGCPGKTF